MENKWQTGLGLLRDMVAAALALAILFGVDLTDDQVAGILALIVTAGAFGSWAYSTLKNRPPQA